MIDEDMRALPWPAAPYKGLTYYSSRDAVLFAGRDDDTGRCGALLAEWKTRLLLLHGSTGCGKSSFLRAGVIPFLEGANAGIAFARASEKEQRPVMFVRATSNPLLTLADAVYAFANTFRTQVAPDGVAGSPMREALPGDVKDAATFRQSCAQDPELLIQVLERLSRLVSETLVLIIDQGEEVLTVDQSPHGESCREEFFEFVGDFVRASVDIKLLVALRTEYFGRFVSRARRNFRGTGIAEYYLDNLDRAQVEEAIRRPTSNEPAGNLGRPFDHYRFTFDDDVVSRILDELADPGTKLPAVQIVCTALYDTVNARPEPRIVSRVDLENVGGVEGAIKRFIDDQIRDFCYEKGLSAGESDIEIRRWKEAMFGLTRPQPDGTVTTDLKPEATFRKELAGSRLDFDEATARFAADEIRLLRKVDVINPGSGALVPCFGLGHDTLGLVLRNWKLSLDKASPLIAGEASDFLDADRGVSDGIAICLSGGGYRAMLFHLGSLWRLNELGYLKRFELLSAVSAGAILAAHLATSWGKLKFDERDIATNFSEVIAMPIRKLAEQTIDITSAVLSIFGIGGSGAERLASRLSDHLYGKATLQDWPDQPRFMVGATNTQYGSLFRFSKAYLGDVRLGRVPSPDIAVATAVAASAALPPMLSPMVLKFAQNDWLDAPPATDPRFSTAVHLTDGALYDYYGIELAWQRYRTILVSEAASRHNDDPEPSPNWPAQISRLLDLVGFSGRAQRRRQIVEAFASHQRRGAFWSLTSRIESYSGARTPPDTIDIEGLDVIATRYATIDARTQQRLINWGYVICDAAMRTHMGSTDSEARPPYKIDR